MTSKQERWGDDAPHAIREAMDDYRALGRLPALRQAELLAAVEAKAGLDPQPAQAEHGSVEPEKKLLTRWPSAARLSQGLLAAALLGAGGYAALRNAPEPLGPAAPAATSPADPKTVDVAAHSVPHAVHEVTDAGVFPSPKPTAAPVRLDRRQRTTRPRRHLEQRTKQEHRLPELELLKRARAQLATAPDASIALLRRHAANYPDGVFAEERQVLLVDALFRSGHAARATKRARKFLAEHPNSAHTRRVRNLLAEHGAAGAN